ncbi:zinc-binding alcohol dehydrogenase family protein [Glaciihabitans arcticus]|uniref:Zinc-binding alcohol dehydrogenase family protein n=1 Tax=Glaciihabitans arcticus TaxID=2668039 RepID=A0A4Q9GXP4_9MICO|nr:zinc-binding alcohol dehydrogenase family protein [Glaciihabitans arcticus]TBN58388.1 zinc-binding alcohol dehydrogenase family protein [Glaciihabitans arcticus]
MNSNSAAFLREPYGDLVVGDAPMPIAGPGEIVIQNRAIAVNPLDAIKQTTGQMMYGWLPHPAILGEDVAGEVAEVGPGVSRFAVGDRVLGYAVGMEKGRNHAAEGGFQRYTVVRALLAAPIPATMAFEDAAVLPLAISTAASALFQRDQLGLRHPTATSPAAVETVVVWGGSTSVGSNAIQLAVAAGYRVVTTASPRNHGRMRELGAAEVFNYASPTVVSDIVRFAADSRVVGILAVGTGSAEPAVAIAAATGAKRVSMASPSVSFGDLPRRRGLNATFVRTMTRLVAANVALQVRCLRHGVRARFVWGSTLMNNEVGPMLWQDFLPAALADGRYLPAPAAEVVGSGLENVQVALDRLRGGVSAKKLVVTL